MGLTTKNICEIIGSRRLLLVCFLLMVGFNLMVGRFNPVAHAQESYLFGDGFESGDYSNWDATVVRGGNTLNVVTEQAHNGSYSSKAVYNGGLWAESEKLDLGTNSFLYARGYFRIASGWNIAVAGAKFEVLMIANDAFSTRSRTTIYYDGTNLQWQLVARFGSGTQGSGNLESVNVDQWYCIEVYYVRNATSEQAKMWIDGVLKSTLTGTSPSPEIINRIYVGFHRVHGLGVGDSVTVFSDDIIAATSYIGPTGGVPETPNTPPVASDLSITPSFPYTTDDLVGSYTYDDADGDLENGTEIRWYKDGVLQPLHNDSLTVSSLSTEVGQVWYFTVRPKDGTDFGDLQTSPSVTIRTPSAYIFEDGFETGDFSSWDGAATAGGDSVSVVSEDSFDGTYSQKAVISNRGHAYNYKGFTDQQTVHVRWYFKFTSDLPDASGENVWLSILLGDNGGTEICRVGIEYFNGAPRIALYNVGGVTYFGSTNLILDSWYSVECRFYKASDGEFRVWLNNTEEINVGLDLSYKPDADQVRIGVARHTRLSPTVYSDSVIVADSHIGT